MPGSRRFRSAIIESGAASQTGGVPWRDVYSEHMAIAVSRLERITVDPEICHGAPTVRGMRLRVKDVLELLASGMTYDEILDDYDELERDDILAVLEFAALDAGARLQRVVA